MGSTWPVRGKGKTAKTRAPHAQASTNRCPPRRGCGGSTAAEIDVGPVRGVMLAAGIAAAVAVADAEIAVARSVAVGRRTGRSEEHTSELQSIMRISYAVFCLKKKTQSYHNAYTDITV